jgi:hypothetical protein
MEGGDPAAKGVRSASGGGMVGHGNRVRHVNGSGTSAKPRRGDNEFGGTTVGELIRAGIGLEVSNGGTSITS